MQIRFAGFLFAFLFAGLFAVTIDTPSQAATTLPTKMNFQGRITNSAGNVLANGTYNMKFRIWNAASAGTQQWSEDRLVSATQGVVVTNGQFSVQLGSVTSLPASIFTSNSLYFEVELPTPATATSSSPTWTEGAMTPRNQLATSAYAYNAETLDGIDSDAFGKLGTANTWTGVNTFNGSGFYAGVIGTTLAIDEGEIGFSGGYTTFNGGMSVTGNLDASGVFQVNQSASLVKIGFLDAAGSVLILDTKNTTGDPTGASATNGAMYYNSFTSKFRCYENGAWKDCITVAGGGSTLQAAYDASGTPATITTTAAKGLLFTSAANVPTADQLVIDNTGSTGTATNGVNGLNIKYKGGAGVIDSSGARIDLTPGTTSGSTWSGLKIAAATTGAASGVNEYGINLDGPTTPGAGDEVGISIDANWDSALQLGSKTGEPGLPATDSIYVYASKYAGRSLLSQKGPNGIAFAYQPAWFQNTITQFSPNTTTSGSYIGGSWTIVANASTAAASTETLGFGTNFATAATVNANSGTYQTATQFMRGSAAGGANGFFAVNRLVLPDVAGYGAGATGSRLWSGMTNQTSTTMVGNDNPAGHYAGFQYSTNRNDPSWQFATKDGTTQNVVSTGMALTANKVYDLYVYQPPLGTTVYWRIDNLNDGTTQEGSTTVSLPGTTTALRAAAGIGTLSATARNIRVNKFYVESDR